jgi:predicted DNA binding CopG/RHH family protein
MSKTKKRNPGRPSFLESPTRITLSLSEKDHEEAKRRCAEIGCSVAEQIRRLMAKWLQQPVGPQ